MTARVPPAYDPITHRVLLCALGSDGNTYPLSMDEASGALLTGAPSVRRATFAHGDPYLANALSGDPLAVDVVTTPAIEIAVPDGHVLHDITVDIRAALAGSTSGQVDITAYGGDHPYEVQIDITGGDGLGVTVEGVEYNSTGALTFFASTFPSCTSVVVTVTPSDPGALTGCLVVVKLGIFPQR